MKPEYVSYVPIIVIFLIGCVALIGSIIPFLEGCAKSFIAMFLFTVIEVIIGAVFLKDNVLSGAIYGGITGFVFALVIWNKLIIL